MDGRISKAQMVQAGAPNPCHMAFRPLSREVLGLYAKMRLVMGCLVTFSHTATGVSLSPQSYLPS